MRCCRFKVVGDKKDREVKGKVSIKERGDARSGLSQAGKHVCWSCITPSPSHLAHNHLRS